MKRLTAIAFSTFLFTSIAFAASSATLMGLLSGAAGHEYVSGGHFDPSAPTIRGGSLALNAQYLVFKEDLPYDNPDASLKDGGKISGTLVSTLWGDFDFANLALTNVGPSPDCAPATGKKSVKLKISAGSAVSSYWGSYPLSNGYYCPFSGIDSGTPGKLFLDFTSATLGDIPMGNVSGMDPANFNPTTLKGLAYNGTAFFSNNQKSIDTKIAENVRYLESTITKFDAKTLINKNIETVTRGQTPDTDTTPSLTSADSLLYYKQSVTINGSVSGKKTLIVQGGDVTIGGNMKYTTPDSLLIIVVKKVEGVGGSIYIKDNVTNVVGTLIADGSILASGTNKTKQLLIYGSLFTNNTIGGSVGDTRCPSGMSSCDPVTYDLARLREFTVIPSKNITNGVCSTYGTKLVPTDGNTTQGIEYAWAGGWNCVQNEGVSSDAGLRTTDKTNPIVIEYNTLLQSSGMKVLSN